MHTTPPWPWQSADRRAPHTRRRSSQHPATCGNVYPAPPLRAAHQTHAKQSVVHEASPQQAIRQLQCRFDTLQTHTHQPTLQLHGRDQTHILTPPPRGAKPQQENVNRTRVEGDELPAHSAHARQRGAHVAVALSCCSGAANEPCPRMKKQHSLQPERQRTKEAQPVERSAPSSHGPALKASLLHCLHCACATAVSRAREVPCGMLQKRSSQHSPLQQQAQPTPTRLRRSRLKPKRCSNIPRPWLCHINAATSHRLSRAGQPSAARCRSIPHTQQLAHARTRQPQLSCASWSCLANRHSPCTAGAASCCVGQ